MKFRKIVSVLLTILTFISLSSASAMTTTEFEAGMKKGKKYFSKDMYIEARDEFQWFCDYNWSYMNDGQRQYALEYLDGAKEKCSTEYVYMYAYYDNAIQTIYIHKNKINEYAQSGWSLTRPATKYEPTYAGLESMAVKYWKEWLYWPNSATIHQMRVASTWDDWDNGILYADVYIDGTVLTDWGWYDRKFYVITLRFNKYTGEYKLIDLEET